MVETLWYSFEITPATGDFMTVVFFNTTVLYTCYSTVHYITVHHCTGQDFKMLQYSWDTDHECKFLDKEWVTIYKNRLMAQ